MKVFYTAALILLLFPSLVVSLFLSPVEYVQCVDLQPDEWLDTFEMIDAPEVDFSNITAQPVDFLHPDLPVFSRPSAFRFHSLQSISDPALLREANSSPVMLL
jgi:hypothetical protein